MFQLELNIKNINTLKLSHIQSILWILKRRQNSNNKEEKGNSSFYNEDQISCEFQMALEIKH